MGGSTDEAREEELVLGGLCADEVHVVNPALAAEESVEVPVIPDSPVHAFDSTIGGYPKGTVTD